MKAILVLAALVSITSCSNATETETTPDHLQLMPIPDSHVLKCRRLGRLSPACPRSVPFVEVSQERARAFRSGRAHFVFFSEWSGPYPGVSRKNAPPRFAHLVVHAGDLDQALPFHWPQESMTVPDPIPTKRREPILLDRVTWSDKDGGLVLAPSFPSGGIDGDHVIFRWTQDGDQYAISLHAWLPLDDTIAALEAVVASIPRQSKP
jgi:hypothetical protein